MIDISSKKLREIPLNNFFKNYHNEKIGIDVGQTLTKICFAEEKSLYLIEYLTDFFLGSYETLLNSFNTDIGKINLTGGKAFEVFRKLRSTYKCILIDEFDCVAKGIEFSSKIFDKQCKDPKLIINIGTGTSIMLKDQKLERVVGSALGGGFFMGMMHLIFNSDNFDKLVLLSRKGNRYNLDLKVSDIYHQDDIRINKLFREYTAASFGKINKDFNTSSVKLEDIGNSVICLIGENIGTLVELIADKSNIKNLIYVGGFLKNNKVLKRLLSIMATMNKKKAIFPQYSQYMGSIGALLYNVS